MTKVQCRCGAVEIEITAEPIVQFYCHCDDCQAVHGGAYAPESVYPADAVKVVRGDPTTWKLKRNPRFTCRECGTRLFIDVLRRSACAASMDSCSRRANSSLRFMCSASSRSGRSSTTCRIIRACRRVSAARTKRLGGSAERASIADACHARESGHPAKGENAMDSRFRGNDNTTAVTPEARPPQNLYPIRAPTWVRPGLMCVHRLACEMCSTLAITSQCSSNW